MTKIDGTDTVLNERLYWKQLDGTVVAVKDMSDSHVRNAFAMLLRNRNNVAIRDTHQNTQRNLALEDERLMGLTMLDNKYASIIAAMRVLFYLSGINDPSLSREFFRKLDEMWRYWQEELAYGDTTRPSKGVQEALLQLHWIHLEGARLVDALRKSATRVDKMRIRNDPFGEAP